MVHRDGFGLISQERKIFRNQKAAFLNSENTHELLVMLITRDDRLYKKTILHCSQLKDPTLQNPSLLVYSCSRRWSFFKLEKIILQQI